MMQDILEVCNIDEGFNGVPVPRYADLGIYPGEVHALYGENGASKSTLMRVLSGVYPHGQYDGTIIFGGKEAQFRPIKDSEVLGVGVIHQELVLVPYLSIAENTFLGVEKPRKFDLIGQHEVNHHAEKVLEKVGLNESVTAQVDILGVSKQQLIEIGKALFRDMRLPILDEPIAVLNDSDSAQLLGLVHSLYDQGVAIVIISHKLGEIAEIADRTAILCDGQTIDTVDMKNPASTQGKIIPLMIGRDLTQRYLERDVEIGEEVFRVEDWTVYHPTQTGRIVIPGASFNVRHGEVIGIASPMGVGRIEPAMGTFGRSFGMRVSGKLPRDDKEITIKPVSDVIKYDIAYAIGDRRQYNLSFISDIRHNVATTGPFKFSRRDLIGSHKGFAVTADYKEWMNIRSNSVLQKTGSLSSGNQQKVVLSRWLHTGVDVLIPGEPTRDVGVSTKFEIYMLINEMVERDEAVIVTSSELEEILDVSNRIYTLAYGHITDEVRAEGAIQENLMELITIEPAREEQE